ncbi:MAG: hypothetical protein JWQ38_3823 [Flavipsychrobacter sp.]|nr:hypothetical protein [Flavipsychrobacter sp.]
MRNMLTFIVLLLATAAGYAQDVKYIQLKQEKVSHVPKTYHFADVVDEREDVTNIGTMKGGGSSAISLSGGVAASLNTFVVNNVKQNKATQPVSLHISKLNFDMKKRGGIWNVDAEVLFTFYVTGKKVIEYSSKGKGQMDSDPAVYIEGFIRQAIGNDVKKFDEWWAENRGNVPTSSEVKVNVHLAKTTDKPNTIIYSLQQPLQISDFMGRVDGKEFELAVTVSGIGVAYSSTIQNSHVTLDIIVTPYFNKATSWFKPEGRNTRVLAHEQTHFDITAIKACELVAAIRNAPFTQENYAKLLEELQFKNAEESNNEEIRYDNETNHGIITSMQEAWEKKITAQVKATGCY